MVENLTQLASWSKVMITLEELMTLFHRNGQSYEELSTTILKLEDELIIQAVKSAGRTIRQPSIAYRYRIDKVKLQTDFREQLHRYNERFHNAIRLDRYYSLLQNVLEKDLPFIEHIHSYLVEKGLPNEPVPAPERSVELVGDEKWIDEGGGRETLERIGLWNKMKIIPVSDPLMMAVNPEVLHNRQQYHLIVENKTTYQALLPVLTDTVFSTLIYGAGNKIVKSIEQFDWQLPVKDASHDIYYFGDVDRSGIMIWHLLNEKRCAYPALPFYEACLKKEAFSGKINQKMDKEAIQAFITTLPSMGEIKGLLEIGFYYPQEILKSDELALIWREWSWRIMNGKD